MAQHWHVARHNEDDDVFTSDAPAPAFAYAATELHILADHLTDGITSAGEAGDYESAYRMFTASNVVFALAQNAENIAAQWSAESADDRAPLYRGPGWQDRLATATDHVRQSIARAHEWQPLRLWRCPDVAACGRRTDDV